MFRRSANTLEALYRRRIDRKDQSGIERKMTSADFSDFRGRRMADFMVLANLRIAPLS
jgi:hypothetical protein